MPLTAAPSGGLAAAEPPPSADLRHVDTWLFDLDNTLYPQGTEFVTLIEGRMTAFVQRETGLPNDEAYALQKRYLHEHGATLAGLMAHHAGIDPHAFLDEVHDVSTDSLQPDPTLNAVLAALPGRRLIFTNGHAAHAERVLERLGLSHLFSEVFHLESADLVPKPDLRTFHRMMEAHAVVPGSTAFFEDSVKNLAPAAELGMTTVLVGRSAGADSSAFIDHRTGDLAGFLARARTSAEP